MRCRCNGFNSFCTPDYRLHLFESGSGIKFVMRTDPNVAYAKVGNSINPRSGAATTTLDSD